MTHIACMNCHAHGGVTLPDLLEGSTSCGNCGYFQDLGYSGGGLVLLEGEYLDLLRTLIELVKDLGLSGEILKEFNRGGN